MVFGHLKNQCVKFSCTCLFNFVFEMSKLQDLRKNIGTMGFPKFCWSRIICSKLLFINLQIKIGLKKTRLATPKRNFSKFLPYKSLIVIFLATVWRLSSKLSENIEIMGLSNVYGRLYARYYKGSCEESISWIEQAKKDNLEGFCFIILSQFQRKIKGTAQWRMAGQNLKNSCPQNHLLIFL